jgi:hypothetical protein
MPQPNTILQQVKEAYRETNQQEEFVQAFATKVENIIKGKSSTRHYNQQDITSDIAFLCRISRDNEFAKRQLIKLVTDYIEHSLDIDPLSRQDETKNFTYMKSIRN